MSDQPQRRDFLKTVTPIRIVLLNAAAELQPTLYWRRSDGERVLSARYSSGTTGDRYFDVLGTFDFSVKFREATDAPGAAAITSGLRIACSFLGHFHVDEGTPSQQDVDAFAQSDAWLLFWPYFRQYVFDTTSRMDIRSETLPLAFGPGEATKTPKPAKASGKPNSRRATKK